jgi:hypothetical protein
MTMSERQEARVASRKLLRASAVWACTVLLAWYIQGWILTTIIVAVGMGVFAYILTSVHSVGDET